MTLRLAAVVMLMLRVTAAAAEPMEIRGKEAEAIALAIKQFKSHPGLKDEQGWPVYGDLRHYSVQLERHGRRFEVIFIPDADKYGTIGGGTAYGSEVHYIFTLNPLKLVEQHFAR
jgi:hypothetical protein